MFCYLKSTTNMRLFHPNDSESDLMGYVYACYFTYSHNGWSQTRCLFTCGSTMVSWWYMKQTIVTISSNHIELWGKLWICLVKIYYSTCARNLWLSPTKMTIYEDNSILKGWYKYPKDSFMWKSGRFNYKVFAKKNCWAIGPQD